MPVTSSGIQVAREKPPEGVRRTTATDAPFRVTRGPDRSALRA